MLLVGEDENAGVCLQGDVFSIQKKGPGAGKTIGFVTPPMGINLFVASNLTNMPIVEIAKKAVPMVIMFLVALLLITFIPQISLALV